MPHYTMCACCLNYTVYPYFSHRDTCDDMHTYDYIYTCDDISYDRYICD